MNFYHLPSLNLFPLLSPPISFVARLGQTEGYEDLVGYVRKFAIAPSNLWKLIQLTRTRFLSIP